MFGDVYGEEHVAEREQARSLLVELIRRHEVLYTPEVAHLAFEAVVRNFIDLVEEGILRMFRVKRKGTMRESLWPNMRCPLGKTVHLHGFPPTASTWFPNRGFDKRSLSPVWREI